MINIEKSAENFKTFCKNILLDKEQMDQTISEITKKLNTEYYDLKQDSVSNMYVVGSVGRNSAIKSSSDLDLLFDLPNELFKKYDNYENNGQSALLQDVKNTLLSRYPKTKIRGDGQVVVLEFTNYTVELVPGFKQNDERFKYPDTHDGGSWKYTDPLSEQNECKKTNKDSNGIFLDFCHIIRSWKNKIGFSFKGLLIDTLVYNHLKENDFYADYDYSNYIEILKSIFEYFKSQNKEQSYWFALGSNQKIYNDDNAVFVTKAKKALKQIEETTNINETLKELLGNDFPYESKEQSFSSCTYENTEEFIENKYPVDIRYNLQIDGKIFQNGFRVYNILDNVSLLKPIMHNRSINFFIKNTNCPEPYSIYWKIRNVGKLAEEKNQIRGQIIKGDINHKERSSFYGPHFVECYIVKNGICVARDRIDVPIGKE